VVVLAESSVDDLVRKLEPVAAEIAENKRLAALQELISELGTRAIAAKQADNQAAAELESLKVAAAKEAGSNLTDLTTLVEAAVNLELEGVREESEAKDEPVTHNDPPPASRDFNAKRTFVRPMRK
jgi:hypothetical protein